MTQVLLERKPSLRLRPPSSPDLTAYRLAARDWLRLHAPVETPSDLDGRFEVLRRWQYVLYEGGYVGIGLPTSWGGQGHTTIHQYVFTEELARAGLPAPIGLIGLDVVGPTIVAYGTDRQRETLLPPLLSGTEIWCQGFSEPGAGSDLAAVSTRADRDGDAYVVNGQKVWTSWAHKAQRCALLVRTGDQLARHRTLSYLLVDMASPGVTVRPLTQMTGDSEFCEVFFDDVKVPVENLLGAENEGWAIAMDTLSHERATYAFRRRVEAAAIMSEAVRAIRKSASTQPLSDHELAAVGQAQVALWVLEAQNLETLRRVSRHPGPSAEDSVDKLVLNGCEQAIYRGIFECLGPTAASAEESFHGLSSERVVRDYLYSRAASIYGGSSQIQRNIVATRGLGLPA